MREPKMTSNHCINAVPNLKAKLRHVVHHLLVSVVSDTLTKANVWLRCDAFRNPVKIKPPLLLNQFG